MYPLAGIEDLTDIQCHPRFLEGAGHLRDLIDDRAAGHSDIDHGLRIKCVADRDSRIFQITVQRLLIQRLYQNDALLIHFSDQITFFTSEQTADDLHRRIVSLMLRFYNKYDTPALRFDMEFLCAVIDIHQEQIIQKKILDEIVPVEPLPVSNDQILKLAHRDPSDHMYIFTGTSCDQDILRFILPHYFKEMIPLKFLAVGW